ncbi:Poly(ADP-ribose) glycohydrolase [Bagarius yarrelli]|uniref:poly(ADP-ribose) glycohydrolase n=1 Tax=Bagarius yarrelli TaxID=175774 RepID=A0A556U3B3_BAGYA|nr:Poly(ADP-ribose) glycohydrolase [Bagarius yarrelli]
MAFNNDRSHMHSCCGCPDMPREGKAGPSQEFHSSPKQRHSDSGWTETNDWWQKAGTDAPAGAKWGESALKREPECHMELDRLCADSNHTVLIDTRAFSNGKIVPCKGQPIWDSNHVKLPQHYPINSRESRWAATERALQTLMHRGASARDVETAIKIYNQAHSKDWHFDGLRIFAEPIPLLRQHCSHAITMSQVQISCLLANAFFCTFPHRNATHPGSEYGNFPTINFSRLFSERSPRTFQKLRALFHYFDTVTEEATKPTGLVTFERICLPQNQWPDWNKRMEQLTNLEVYGNGFIEREGKGMLQVDFAASMVGGGVLGRGLVQEEIRFMQCPELIVSRLFTEKLADNECLRITGVQTYSNTRGYSDTFAWESPHKDNTQRDEWKRIYCQIVAIDATNFQDPRQQYTERSIQRELLKAYVGFRGDPNIPSAYTAAIATGNWGCGAFKGDPMLKALIQMMAASVAQRDLAYFTFNNMKQAEELKRMFMILKSQKITVGKLYNLLQDYCDYSSRHHHHHQQRVKNVFEFISEKIGVCPSHL